MVKVIFRSKYRSVILLGIILFLFFGGWSTCFENSCKRDQTVQAKSSTNLSTQSFYRYQQPIIVVNLFIDRKNKTIEIKSLNKGRGIVPDYRNSEVLDFAQVVITKKDGKKQFFPVPLPAREVYAPSRDPKKFLKYPQKKLEKFNFSIVLPYEEESNISITKEFQDNFNLNTASVSLTIPKSSNQKIRTLSNKKVKDISISNLSIDKFFPQSTGFQIETIFDGNPGITDPKKTLDIVFVSSGYNEGNIEQFRSFSNIQADSLIGFSSFSGKVPFSNNKSVIKVRRIVSNSTFHSRCGEYFCGDITEVINAISSLGVPFDQIAVVLNEDGRSGASLGGGYSFLFNRWGGNIERNLLFAHEFAHSFGAVLDEYIEYWGESGFTSYLNRNCKNDPLDPWAFGLSGGAYLGCDYYWNIYRPEPSSLMVTLDNTEEFNNQSEYLLEQALSSYTGDSILVLTRDLLETMIDVSDSWGRSMYRVFIANIGNNPISFRGYIDPALSGVSGEHLEGNIGSGAFSEPSYSDIYFDYSKFTTKGKYQTNLVLEIRDSLSQTKIIRIPIIIFVGDRGDGGSITINNPRNGGIFTTGASIPISINQNIPSPGWRWIDYYYNGYFYDPGTYEDKNIISSRTHSPYGAVWETYMSYPGGSGFNLNPGTYTLKVKGYPYFGETVESQVEIELSAVSGTSCTSGPNYNFSCTNNKTSRKCFRGAEDCQRQSLTFCCPPSTTPTPTIIPKQIDRIMIEPPVISTFTNALPIGISALAYDSNNQPIWEGIAYEWGISSNNSIGNVNPIYGNITNFTPLNSGDGDLYVTAKSSLGDKTKSIPVRVTAVSPTPTITCTPSSGNANGDSFINLSDFEIWREERHVGTGRKADFNCIDGVNINDFGVWKGNFR